jgi:hypothetical protein
MKKIYFLCSLLIGLTGLAQNVTITKVIETGCADPFVKTVELYVDGTIDFSTEVVLNYMQNGGAWADSQIDISALGTVTDSFVYITRDIPLMEIEFPSATFNTSNTIVVGTSTNGDDGYQIVLNGAIVSQFGRTDTDADDDTESNWNHNDAIATRLSGIPDLGTWNPADWVITAEDALDDFTACQNSGTSDLETYFNTLGGTYPLGSGSGWTPTVDVCTTVLVSAMATCDTTASGATDDTYTASIEFTGANNGNTFIIMASEGTLGGDDPSTVASGTITITGISEGTDITVTVNDTADGGVCALATDIDSPGCIPLIINEVLFDPAADDAGTTDVIEGDANGDGTRDAAEDEFIEFYNNSSSPLDVSGYTISDATEVRHIFPPSSLIPANEFLVVFGGGTPNTAPNYFGDAIIQKASEGTEPELNLSNSGDTITIRNTDDAIVLIYVSSDTGISHSSDESVTRNPDITGDFTLHTDANAVLAFSPGTLISGPTLSINQFGNSSFNVYPNPVTNGYVNIRSNDSETIQVSVFDILGKQVRNATLSNNDGLDVSLLKSGLYILKISQNNKTINKKILIN